ncbi:MAG: aspartyl/asparaginyl beta-hydroxylase domain-containing protein [Gammaproteobacteria bacterium]|nr:aspartyl/asparaginyl beta-hydroxylase domain-containing protein [Gammaproteobacteria bacterium]MDH4255691.1 aspartyl/asparaginyl beta-hydroxylase domain-containing protein [Gammaproteobacteria bacterium]MDH5310420.1 aspartyl/asparaginyl beta-hydroxylase domain-containing protein [Gammaproteobacteria bacterium]
MNFPGNFRYIGEVDVSALKTLVLGLPEDQWQRESYRQQRYEVHRSTETINLVFDPDFRHTHPTRFPALETFEPLIRPALGLVADYYETSPRGRELLQGKRLGYFIRANVVRLKAGGDIPPHKDGNFSLAHSHRVHLPIITNDEVRFSVGSETRNLPEGTLYEINNRRTHSVHNAGPEDRVHLILDYVLRGEKCCCGERLHPDTVCSPQACLETDQFRIPCTCFPDDAAA